MFLKNVFNFQSNKSTTIAQSIALIFVIMVFSVGALADDKLTYEIRTHIQISSEPTPRHASLLLVIRPQ